MPLNGYFPGNKANTVDCLKQPNPAFIYSAYQPLARKTGLFDDQSGCIKITDSRQK